MNVIEVTKRASLTGHQNPIFTVAKGNDPTVLFTAGNDKGVVEWNALTAKFSKILLPVKTSVYCLHLLPNSTLMAVGERSGLVTIIDIEQQRVLTKLSHHQKPIFDILAFNTKTELIVCSEDGTVSVWDTITFNLLYHFKVSNETVRCIGLNHQETVIALGTKDAKVKLLDSTEYSLVKEINEHSAGVTSLCFSQDDAFLLTGGRDAQLNIFDTKQFALVKKITAHMFSIYAISYHPHLPFFATASRDKSIKFWRAQDFSLLKNISFEKGHAIHRLSINSICWLDDHTLASVSDDKTVILWDIQFPEH